MAKFGQRVYVKELDTYGVVYAMSSGKVTHVLTDDGKVIEVIDKTIVVLTLLRKLWLVIKELFKLITVLVLSLSTVTLFGQNVKLRQIERTPVKWQVVSAYDSLGSSFALKYINLQDLIDTLNLDLAGSDSIYLQNDTIFLRDGEGFVDLSTLTASIDTSKWTLSGTNLYPKDNNWKVGIGTQTPSLPLEVNGDALINGIRYGNAGVAPFTNIRIGNEFTLGTKTTGGNNIGIGTGALFNLTTGINNIAIGSSAGLSFMGNNLVAIGHQAFKNGTGNDNISIGALAMQNYTASSSIGIGFRALENGTGSTNISIGADAMRNYTGNASVAIGGNNPLYSGSGLRNSAIGFQSMNNPSRSSGSYNTAIGAGAIQNATNCNNNTAIGESAMTYTTSGSENTAIGRQTFFLGNVNRGIAIGFRAGYYETQDDRLYISNQTGADEANGRQKAIIYGVMSSTTANQILDLNAKVKPTYKPGTATILAGYDANGYMANVSLGSNLNILNGTLSASDTDNQLLSYNSTAGNLSISGGNTVNIPLFSTINSTRGLVPGSNGASSQFLRGDGTWATPTATLSGGSASKVAFWTSSSTLSNNTNFHWNNSTESLGVGTSSPLSKLHVNNTASNFISTQGFTITHSNASVTFKSLFSGSNSFQMTTGTPFANNGIYINNSGDNIGIRTSAPTTNLHVNGTARITGSTGTPTSIVGRDANGNISNITLGTGLSITSGTLNATSNSIQVNVYTTPGTYTWTKPSGAKAVYVKLIGGGGGGQGGGKYASGAFAPGGAGGHGGGLSEFTYRANELPSSVTVVVGSPGIGGAGATANSTNGVSGGPGGNSSFHAVVAKGGRGGDNFNLTKIGLGITDDGSIGGYWQDGGDADAENTKVSGAGGAAGGAINQSNSILSPTSNGSVMLFTGSYISPTIVGGDGGAGGAASTTGNGGNGGTGSPGRFGGGGGGGGAARNGVGNGGNGGAGQGGAVLVITYF